MLALYGDPGVWQITALIFKGGVHKPHRFRRSKIAGAHFGLTPQRIHPGDSIDFGGHISGIGDAEVRTTRYEAAYARLTKDGTQSGLKARVCSSQNAAVTRTPPWLSPASWR